ncbi:MAG: hypothetical protein COT71_02140, partial [Candidatus Andersenbacteria bacterium CG10_big_fil_rev_8_21_14_0_10_54_11]
LDAETIVSSAVKTGRVVTAEDHSVNGGLGSAVEEVLGEYHPTPMRRELCGRRRKWSRADKRIRRYDYTTLFLKLHPPGVVF